MSLQVFKNENGYCFQYDNNEIKFQDGKIMLNGDEVVTKQYVIDLVNSVTVKDEFDLLTRCVDPVIELKDMFPPYLDGSYTRIDHKYTLYSGSCYQQFIAGEKDVWQRDNGDGTFTVIIYTISLEVGEKILNKSFELNNPAWLILKYDMDVSKIPTNTDHVNYFNKIESSLGSEDNRFGLYRFPKHPNVTYLQ